LTQKEFFVIVDYIEMFHVEQKEKVNMSKGLGKGLGALIAMFDEENEAIKSDSTNIDKATVKTADFFSAAMDDKEQERNVPRGTKQETDNVANGVQEIDISLIDNNINQPRKTFDPVQLQELADSITANGVFQPILVNKVGTRFMIIAGERRWRASKIAGLVTVPALVKNYSARQIAEIAIVENLQRENLNEIELALGVKKLMDEFMLTQEKVAKVLGKSRSAIANTLRLLNLPKEVQQFIESNQLSVGHAKCLVAVQSPDKCVRFAKKCVMENLNVRQLEDLIKGVEKSFSPSGIKKNPELRRIGSDLTEQYGTKAFIQGNEHNGRIIFEYYDRHDLERICKKLLDND